MRLEASASKARFLCRLICLAVALACGPDLTDPAELTVSGLWSSSDTAGDLYDIRLDLVQDERGTVSGFWNSLGLEVNGQCPTDLSCAPSDSVIGSNTVLQLHLDLRGAAEFTGQVIAPNVFRGNLLRSGANHAVRFERVP
jgi:hypothetical protein